MSAYLDSFSGAGYDGSEAGGVGDIGGSPDMYAFSPQPTSADSSYFSGAMQALTSLGTGYLARRLDVDIYTRASQANPYLGTTQGQILIGPNAPKPGGIRPVQPPTMLNLSALLPFLIVGGAVFMLARKGK